MLGFLKYVLINFWSCPPPKTGILQDSVLRFLPALVLREFSVDHIGCDILGRRCECRLIYSRVLRKCCCSNDWLHFHRFCEEVLRNYSCVESVRKPVRMSLPCKDQYFFFLSTISHHVNHYSLIVNTEHTTKNEWVMTQNSPSTPDVYVSVWKPTRMHRTAGIAVCFIIHMNGSQSNLRFRDKAQAVSVWKRKNITETKITKKRIYWFMQ